MKTNIEVQSIAEQFAREQKIENFGITGNYQKFNDATEGDAVHETRVFKARTSAEAQEMALLDGLIDAGYLLN